MALSAFRDIAASDRFKALEPEKQAEVSKRYWDRYAEENPDDADYVTRQRETTAAYLEARNAEKDAPPVQQRAIRLNGDTAAFNLALGERARRGEIDQEGIDRLTAEFEARTAPERAKVAKTASLGDPNTAKKMIPAFEALGTYARRGGVFGSASLDARMSDILPGGEKDAVETSKTAYGKLRDQIAADFNLTNDELDDVVRHQLDVQTEPVSRDALGNPYIKNEVLAQGAEATTAAINNSTLPWSVKQRMVEGLPERLQSFKRGVVEDVMANNPELAEDLALGRAVADPTATQASGNLPAGYRYLNDDERFSEITAALNKNAASQGFGGAVAGAMSSAEFFPGRASEDATRNRKVQEQLNQVSSALNQSKTQIWGTDAAVFGQGAYSVAEAIGTSVLTGGAGAPIALNRLNQLGKWGKALGTGFNSAAKVAPVAGLAATKSGFQTYEQAIDAGRTPEEAAKLGFGSAAIEFAVTSLFSAIPGGLGGLEEVGQQLRGTAAREALKGGWKTFVGKTALGITGEQAEENLVTALDAGLVQSAINKDMTVDDLRKQIIDTAKVTLLASGPASALGTAAEMRNKPTYEQSDRELEVRANVALAEATVAGEADPLASRVAGEEPAAPVPAGDLASDGAPPLEPGVGDSGLRDVGTGGEVAGTGTDLAPQTDGQGDTAGVDAGLPPVDPQLPVEDGPADVSGVPEDELQADPANVGDPAVPTRDEVRAVRVQTAKDEIAADIASGDIPADVTSFAELQDHVDANLYVNDADREDNLIGELGRREGWQTDDFAGFTNEVISEIDGWLAAGRPNTETTNDGRQTDGETASRTAGLNDQSGDRKQPDLRVRDELPGSVDPDAFEAASPETVSRGPKEPRPVSTPTPQSDEDQEGQRQGRQEVLTPGDDLTTSKVVPPTPATPESEPSTTGIRNAKVDASRKRRGLPERFAPARKTFAEHWDAALKATDRNPQAGAELVNSVRSRPRALTGDENALFTHEQLTREQRVDETLEAINTATDDDARARATEDFNKAQQDLKEIYDVGQATGTLASQSLNTRRILVNQDYSLARMLAREQAIVNEGKPLSAKQRDDVKALHDKIVELEAKNAELEDRVVAVEAEKTFKNEMRRARKEAGSPRGEKPESFLQSQADAARKRIAARRGRLNTGLVGLAAAEVVDYSIIGVSYLANGATKLADFTAKLVEEFGEKLRPFAPEIFAKSKELARENAPAPSKMRSPEEVLEDVKADTPVTGKQVYDLARAHLLNGVDGFENVMAAVLADLQKTHPDLTLRDVHDAYSGYGKVKFPSKEEDAVKLREYRALARLTSQLEDASAGEAPKRTGQQRDEASERVRTLQKQVKETMRRLNIKVPSRAANLRSSLDSIKTRLRNEIEELQAAVERGTPRNVSRTPTELDDEARALKDQLAEKRKAYDAVFKPSGLTDAQRVAKAISSTTREIERVEKELAAGIAAKRETADRSPWSPELGEAKARLDDLRDFRDRMRRAYHNTPDAVLGRTVTRLEKSVARMRKIVETGKLPSRKSKAPFSPTAEVEALLKEQGALKDLVNALRRDGVTEDQKYERAKAAALRNLPKQIAAIEEKLRTGDFSTKRNKATVWTPEIGKLRKELAAQREALKFVKAITTPKRSPQEIRLSREKAAIRARIAKLQQRIRDNDYGPRIKPDPVMDAEKAKLQLEEIKAKRDFNERLFEAQLAQRSTARKVFETVTDVLAVPRSIMTSFDFGAVFRQGGWAALGNPQILFKAFPANFKSMTEAGAQRYQNQIEANSNYALAKKAGLYIAEIGEGHTLNDVEEVYRSRLARKIPVLGAGIKASERVYSTYLNVVRMGLFDSMVKTLTPDGRVSPENAKVIANYVNIATGRGNLGKSENAASALANIFFSPKYVASRFQLLLGTLPATVDLLTGARLRPQQERAARKAIAREYAKTLLGIGLLYAAASAFAGDDEDDKWTINTDPGSADFGKLKIKNTRIDFMAGLLQTTVFLNRVLTGRRVDSQGREVVMRGDEAKFGESVVGTVGKFLRTKLAPLPSTALNLIDGQDVTGNPATPETELIGFLMPLSAGDIQAAIEEQGAAKGTALGLMSLFGVGAQTYGGAETSLEGDIATWLGGDPERYKRDVKDNKVIPIPMR